MDWELREISVDLTKTEHMYLKMAVSLEGKGSIQTFIARAIKNELDRLEEEILNEKWELID